MLRERDGTNTGEGTDNGNWKGRWVAQLTLALFHGLACTLSPCRVFHIHAPRLRMDTCCSLATWQESWPRSGRQAGNGNPNPLEPNVQTTRAFTLFTSS